MEEQSDWLNANQVAQLLNITRQAVGNFHRRSMKDNYRGKFPRAAHTDPLGGRPLWLKRDIEHYIKDRIK
ncbi:helix-turn-helix transcriptional regulator [Paenibacillus xanthanilyticus]|uniref:Helix-turn-helix transcriptional regulator n=1 Tax=Paenibacillus xanthanilyticus TaxID=1783531 RepID=A0ABV8KAR0_9BACL